MALLPDSPAVGAGDSSDAPDWDQRGPGFPRTANGRIDIGAFEVQSRGASRLAPSASSGDRPIIAEATLLNSVVMSTRSETSSNSSDVTATCQEAYFFGQQILVP
jgi:hypothetical protein